MLILFGGIYVDKNRTSSSIPVPVLQSTVKMGSQPASRSQSYTIGIHASSSSHLVTIPMTGRVAVAAMVGIDGKCTAEMTGLYVFARGIDNYIKMIDGLRFRIFDSLRSEYLLQRCFSGLGSADEDDLFHAQVFVRPQTEKPSLSAQ